MNANDEDKTIPKAAENARIRKISGWIALLLVFIAGFISAKFL